MIPAKELFARSFADARNKGIEPTVKDRSRIRMSDDTLARIRRNRIIMPQMTPIVAEADKWEAKPAVLLGSGPSLCNHYEMLKKIPSNFCVVAVDTALPALHAQGIAPHYTGVIEMNSAQSHIWRFLSPDLFKNTIMVVPNYIDSVIHQSWHGPARMFHVWGTTRENEMQQDWGQDLGLINNIRTIATALLYFTVAILGCDPIIMAGHDCAFRPDESYYAGDVPVRLHPSLQDVATQNSLGQPLLAADGKPTQTNRSLWINKMELDRMGLDLKALDDTRRLWSLDPSTLLAPTIWTQQTWEEVLQACSGRKVHTPTTEDTNGN